MAPVGDHRERYGRRDRPDRVGVPQWWRPPRLPGGARDVAADGTGRARRVVDPGGDRPAPVRNRPVDSGAAPRAVAAAVIAGDVRRPEGTSGVDAPVPAGSSPRVVVGAQAAAPGQAGSVADVRYRRVRPRAAGRGRARQGESGQPGRRRRADPVGRGYPLRRLGSAVRIGCEPYRQAGTAPCPPYQCRAGSASEAGLAEHDVDELALAMALFGSSPLLDVDPGFASVLGIRKDSRSRSPRDFDTRNATWLAYGTDSLP